MSYTDIYILPDGDTLQVGGDSLAVGLADRADVPRTTPVPNWPMLPVGANSGDVTFTAIDMQAMNKVSFDGPMILLVVNTDSVPHAVSVFSAVNAYGRVGDIRGYALVAGEVMLVLMTHVSGWQQPDGAVHVDADHSAVRVGAIRLGT